MLNSKEINECLEAAEKKDKYNNPDTGKIFPYSGAWFRKDFNWDRDKYVLAMIDDYPCFDVHDSGDCTNFMVCEIGDRNTLHAFILDLCACPCNERRETIEAYLAKLFAKEIADYRQKIRYEYERLQEKEE